MQYTVTVKQFCHDRTAFTELTTTEFGIAYRLCCAINNAGHTVKAGFHDGTHTLRVFANLTNEELQSMVNAELNPETVTLQFC
jgi:hypothetical protein